MAFKYSGLSLNDEFKQYFLQASNNRIKETYDQFKINSMWKGNVQFGPYSQMLRTDDSVEIIDSSDEEDQTENLVKMESSEMVFGIHSDGHDTPSELSDDFETEYYRNYTDDMPYMNPKDINWRRDVSRNKQGCIEKEIDKVMKAEEIEEDDEIPSTAFNGRRDISLFNERTSSIPLNNRSNSVNDSNRNNMTGRSGGGQRKQAESGSTSKSLRNKTSIPSNQSKMKKRFQCEFCEYSSNYAGNLKKHKRTHTGEKPYRCDICHKDFIQSICMKQHKVTHIQQVPFHCRGCFSGFTQKTDHEVHENVCKYRRYECHICKKFVTAGKTRLKMHMRKHNGEKPFRCEICMMRFTQKGNLKTHLDNIHTKNNH
ncbi:zinc finger protein 652-like [Contarinia nasturtii]|uniref:zinc finger protein 652-like n=1 Tax=Contarinia nasturtii TaxID=265458 RepID=UPI0012D44586|nr:zinc finger protein 652-like [Contarinia nasturtii]